MPVGEIEVPHRVPDGWFVAVSPNRLRAYLVPVPERGADIVEETTSTAALDAAGIDAPTDAEPDPDAPSGPEINAFDAQQRLTSLRITSGILDDVLAAFGENGRLTDVTCVAQGIAPTLGQDAQLEYTFDEDPKIAPKRRRMAKSTCAT